MTENYLIKLILIVAIIIAVLFISYSCSPIGRGLFNLNKQYINKVDDLTNYDTIKNVEDTARAMISSYESDKLMYNQYKDSTDKEQMTWAVQSKIRANRTANIYNNYILKNSYVWKNNIPSDIRSELTIIE